MKERPILMSAPMVRASLAGTKTQTRRAVKKVLLAGTIARNGSALAEDALIDTDHGETYISSIQADCRRDGYSQLCPHGRPGDKLWVRETFSVWRRTSVEYDEFEQGRDALCGMSISEWHVERGPQELQFGYRADRDDGDTTWFPSIHMPRWASRITLEITEVRVQRLQDISEEDAIAEGAFFTDYGRNCFHGGGPTDVNECPASERTHPQREGWSMVSTASHRECLGTARYAFASYFNEVNGPGSWDANPWVWALTFKLEDLCK